MLRIRCREAALIAVLAGALTGCSSQKMPPVDKAKTAETIKAMMIDVQTNFNAGDAERNIAHDARDIVVMQHGQPNTLGAAADLEAVKQIFRAGPSSYTLSDPVVDVADAGDMAVYRATYVYEFTDPTTKKAAVETGNEVAGFKKQPDGAWKIAWIVVSDAPKAGPAGAR